MSLFRTLMTSAAALAVSVGMASAATTITSVVAPTPDSWEAADLNNTISLAGGTFDVPELDDITFSGSPSGARSPFEPYLTVGPDVLDWETLKYFSVGSNLASASPVTLSFGETQTSFSLLWGSVDSYNALTFKLGDTEVGFITGDDVLDFPSAPAASVLALSAAFVTITGSFDSIVFNSNWNPGLGEFGGFDATDTPAFEFASMTATPIPLPAPALLMLGSMGAFGGMAALKRRRKKVA